MLKKILLLSGWMTDLKLYRKYDDLTIQVSKLSSESEKIDYIIGLSLGALIALREWNKSGKLILINPPLPKRNIFVWLGKWIKFILSEGLFLERQKFTKNPFRFITEIIKCVKLLSVDFSKVLDNIPEDKLVVIKGKNDNYFCDQKAVEFMRSKNITVIEVENAGHNWCEEIEKTVNKLIN
ncbi:MAG: hypothetical protein NT136_00480 [Candidatus Moranbacteria bacterium]|nr:hypothetical protein [Candidatus Moranbacteria bacterium]